MLDETAASWSRLRSPCRISGAQRGRRLDGTRSCRVRRPFRSPADRRTPPRARHGFTALKTATGACDAQRNTSRAGRTDDSRGRHRRPRGPALFHRPRQPPAPGLAPYTATQLRGRTQYISHGCMYCHSQQPRTKAFAPDAKRGWGRATVAATMPTTTALLGTMRTGPDLMNIGARQPSDQWHLGHLYQPRAYVPNSIMPAYPSCSRFATRPKRARRSSRCHRALPRRQGRGRTPQALELVSYLKSLDRSYPAVEAATN